MADSPAWAMDAYDKVTTPTFANPVEHRAYVADQTAERKRTDRNARIRRGLERPA